MVLCWFFNLIFFILSYFITFIIMGESVMGCIEIGLERMFLYRNGYVFEKLLTFLL